MVKPVQFNHLSQFLGPNPQQKRSRHFDQPGQFPKKKEVVTLASPAHLKKEEVVTSQASAGQKKEVVTSQAPAPQKRKRSRHSSAGESRRESDDFFFIWAKKDIDIFFYWDPEALVQRRACRNRKKLKHT